MIKKFPYFLRSNIGLNFYLFLTAISLAGIALNCIRFAISWVAMKETESAISFAFIFSMSSLVEVYSRPILSPMADYFDRLRVYRTCIALGLITVVLIFAAIIFFPFSIPILTFLLILLSLIAGLRDPASAGLVTTLVPPEKLTEAQALRTTVSSIVSLGAPMVSALLLASGGSSLALGGAVLASVVAVAITFRIRLSKSVQTDALGARRLWADYFRTWHLRTIDGFRAVFLTRAERNTAVAIAMSNAGLFPFFSVVLPLWVATSLGGSANTMAAIDVAFSLGIFLGSTLVIRRTNMWMGRFSSLVCGNGLMGAALLAASFTSNLLVLILCFVFGGVGFAMFNITAGTLRAAATPMHFRSRVAGGVAFISSCLSPFAVQSMGFVVQWQSASVAVALCGALILSATLVLIKNKDAKSLLKRPNEDLVDAYANMYPHAFAERDAVKNTQ